jgi:hypothetical protein
VLGYDRINLYSYFLLHTAIYYVQSFGGSGEIRTHGTLRFGSFQDC